MSRWARGTSDTVMGLNIRPERIIATAPQGKPLRTPADPADRCARSLYLSICGRLRECALQRPDRHVPY